MIIRPCQYSFSITKVTTNHTLVVSWGYMPTLTSFVLHPRWWNMYIYREYHFVISYSFLLLLLLLLRGRVIYPRYRWFQWVSPKSKVLNDISYHVNYTFFSSPFKGEHMYMPYIPCNVCVHQKYAPLNANCNPQPNPVFIWPSHWNSLFFDMRYATFSLSIYCLHMHTTHISYLSRVDV